MMMMVVRFIKQIGKKSGLAGWLIGGRLHVVAVVVGGDCGGVVVVLVVLELFCGGLIIVILALPSIMTF